MMQSIPERLKTNNVSSIIIKSTKKTKGEIFGYIEEGRELLCVSCCWRREDADCAHVQEEKVEEYASLLSVQLLSLVCGRQPSTI